MNRLIPVLSAFCWSFAIESSGSDSEPQLVIDAHGHSGIVKEIEFTPDGTRVISVGLDKSIRIWDRETGDLLRTLHLQRGKGKEGRLYTCCLSPDGRWLAVGGWSATEDGNPGVITVIDFPGKRVAATLHGHFDVVHSLDFSPDGKWLASGSSDNDARVWETSAWSDQEIGPEGIEVRRSIPIKGHINWVYGVRFLGDSDRLVTGSFDYSLRFWEKNSLGNEFVEKAMLADHNAAITRVEVSHDGKWIVSGDYEGKLFLWEAESMSLAGKLDEAMELAVGGIAISPEGDRVLASSRSLNGGKTAVYSLPDGKEEKAYSFHDNTVTAAAWSPGGEVATLAGSHGHRIDLFEVESGKLLHSLQGKGKSVWGAGMHSGGEAKIAFGFVPPSPRPELQWIFDLEGLSLRRVRSDAEAGEFHQALEKDGDRSLRFESASLLHVGNDGDISPPDAGERFNVASFTSDGNGVLIGSSFHLYRFRKADGGFVVGLAYEGHEGEIRMVAPSIDDAYLLSGSLDQTARIWDQESGDLLASLFVSVDREWVLWTPEGYFAASPGGGRHIGWHSNRGIGRLADFLSSDQVHDAFYRPDVVKTAIRERKKGSVVATELGLSFDLSRAIGGAPEVEILAPSSQAERIVATERRFELKVRARDGGTGIGVIRVFHEGKRLHPDGPGTFRDGTLEVPYTVSLLSGENTVEAVAVSPEGIESRRQSIQIEYEGTTATARCFVLAVGINEYKNPRFALTYCRPDVDALLSVLERRARPLFDELIIRRLYDEEATSRAITETLEEIAREASEEDVFLFAFAGHGVMSEGGETRDSEFHLIPWEVTQLYGNDELLAEKALSSGQLLDLTSSIPARKQLMVLDACQSGGIVERFALRGAAEERALAQLARSSGMYVLASTRSEQFAAEAAELGHGLFTYALLEGLEGKGDGNEDGKITIKEVEAWINERVPELSEKHTGTAQYPNSFARGQDFPIGLVP